MLKSAVEIIVYLALAVNAVEAYLIINKIWIRKHEAAVAASQSVAGHSLGVATSLPFAIKYLIVGEYEGAASTLLWVAISGIMIAIGIGFWVPDPRRPRVWQRVKAALRLERREAGDLLRSFRPLQGNRKILEILQQMSTIDHDFDERERDFIVDLTQRWGVDLRVSPPPAAAGGTEQAYSALRRSLIEYLEMHPPMDQAAQLRDLLEAWTTVDKRESDEERLIADELRGILEAYIGQATQASFWEVLVVPQDEKMEGLVARAEQSTRLGGSAVIAGRYFTKRYAEMTCARFRTMQVFAVVDECTASPIIRPEREIRATDLGV